MPGPIGCAAEFWRLRLTKLDEAEGPDFEWREDILYRRPPTVAMSESERFVIEAVALDDVERCVSLFWSPGADEAQAWLAQAMDDLGEMTRSQFEETYFPKE